MDNFYGGFVFGWVFGLVCLGGAIVLDNSSAAHTEAKEYLLQLKDRLDKCEASLPRNETCVLVAVPAPKKEVQ